uniref:SNF-related serine/threonine-protein kinase n=1 Tax=Macrostomum lignano TaxID=282301 RepID=A0A1I8GUW4_9PLAT
RRQQLQPNRHYSCDSAEMRIAGQYELHHTIGRGHFAVVKLARHVFTGEQVAIKVIDKAKLDSSNRESLYQEVMCMKLVQHPNVVRLYDVIDTPNKLYLILELGNGGDLYDFIVRQDDNSGLKESLAKSFFYQIVTAIAYCHRLHVCHRDLKLENCVVFERLGVVKLTDFGFSNVFTPGKYLETSCGSLAYSAPEILLGDSYDAPKVDVWSLGVILFMLVSGRLPFQEPNDSETLARIMDVRYKVPKHVTDQCRSLISRLLQRDPSKRPTLDGILTDDWFADVQHSVYDERPLISLGRISQADQQEVIGKMVDGGLATEQEILEALERDDYNDDVACLEEAGAAGAAAAAAGSGTPPVRLQSPQFSGGGGVGGRLSSLSGLAALCDPIREEETGEGGVLQIPTPVLSSSALFPGAATLQSANIGGGGSSTSSQKRRSSAARESSFSLSSLASSLRSLSSQRVAVDLMRDLGGCPSPINNGSKQNSCVFYPASGNTTTSTTTSNNNNSNSTILAATTAPVASTDEVDLEADSDDDCDREIIDNNSGDDTVDSSRKNATRSSSSNKQPRKESDSNHNRRTGLS